MTVNVLTKTTVTFNHDQVKQLKNLVKKHKADKILNHVKFNIIDNSTVKVTHINFSGKIITEKYLSNLHIDNRTYDSFLMPVSILKNLTTKKDMALSVEVIDSNKLLVNNNGISQVVITEPVNQFPKVFFGGDFLEIGQLNYDTLLKLKAATISVSKSDIRPILQNVLIRKNYITSTDSHRLYKADLLNFYSERDILLSLGLIDTITAQESKNFKGTIKVNDKFVLIETGNSRYYGQMQEGKYPEIERLIPDMFSNIFTINDVETLKDVVKNIIKLTKPLKSQVMYFEILDNQTLKITAGNDVIGKIDTTIKINSQKVENGFKVAFNSSYLLDTINQQGSTSLTFNFTSNTSPFVVNGKDQNTISLMLPVRIS